jgi:signal transduction histidine kinase
MPGLRRALLALFAVGVLCAGADVALVLTSHHDDQKVVTAILGPLIGLGFIGTGAFAWWRRPLNRFGLLMTAVGFAWFIGGMTESNNSVVYTVGSYIGPLYLVLVVQMVLSFPTGRLEAGLVRAIVVVAYLTAFVFTLPVFLLDGDLNAPDGAPDNAFAVLHARGVADAIDVVTSLLGVGIAAATAVVLIRRRRLATPPQRRAQAPMLWTGLTVIVFLGLVFAGDTVGLPDEIIGLVGFVGFVAFAILPFAFLAGLVRTRYSRAGAVGGLIERLNTPDTRVSLRAALSDALGDPTLHLVYWRQSAGHYVTYEGHRVDLPERNAGPTRRAVAEVERDGKRVGAILYDAALRDDPSLVRAAAAAAALQLENERLEAELRARVEELQTSRARLVEVSMGERRRLERDLHDGAQQRLVALSLQLGLARRKMESDPATGARLLDAARTELGRALEELRELARGIHPAILTDRGLGAALHALAERAPLPVDLHQMPEDRLPPAVEAAAYFVVAESLTNVAKYSSAQHASVRVGRRDGFAVVEVSDDGVGGADPAAGTGLRGLADRLAALDGRLEVQSPPGGGTVIRANIPCATCA